jgi:hypothetical protein
MTGKKATLQIISANYRIHATDYTTFFSKDKDYGNLSRYRGLAQKKSKP